jgi:RNA polymerase sigma factor (sigma-70 family)
MLKFQEIYELYSDDIYRFAFSLSGDRHEAEDITSDTFVRAWVNKDRIRTETLKAYLFTIARNLFLGQRRKRRSHELLDELHIDSAPAPDKIAESRVELKRVQKVLHDLPEADRTAFVLRPCPADISFCCQGQDPPRPPETNNDLY